MVSPVSANDTAPGAMDAMEAAARQAVEDAVSQMLRNVPDDIESIAVFPVLNDDDGFFKHLIEHELIQEGGHRGFRVVTRSESEWDLLIGEFVFTEDNFDIMPEEQLRRFGRVLGADALVWSRVRALGMDDTGLKGRARVETRLGVVETGQLAGSGSGIGLVAVDSETFITAFVFGLIGQPWFWPMVVIAIVGGVVLAVVWLWLKRRVDLATKPREVVR
ncbi:MAG: hypothetical protein EA377_02305 [Phycisphaerales bacterium]|nr:MAG: hypothetical protein EA377_02305 [Phycisphaerales bacterium]